MNSNKRTPSPDHIEGFFKGLEHAREIAAGTERGKDRAIEREIVTLRLCQHVGKTKTAPSLNDIAGGVGFLIIFTMPFWGSWVFHALTGNLMQF